MSMENPLPPAAPKTIAEILLSVSDQLLDVVQTERQLEPIVVQVTDPEVFEHLCKRHSELPLIALDQDPEGYTVMETADPNDRRRYAFVQGRASLSTGISSRRVLISTGPAIQAQMLVEAMTPCIVEVESAYARPQYFDRNLALPNTHPTTLTARNARRLERKALKKE